MSILSFQSILKIYRGQGSDPKVQAMLKIYHYTYDDRGRYGTSSLRKESARRRRRRVVVQDRTELVRELLLTVWAGEHFGKKIVERDALPNAERETLAD